METQFRALPRREGGLRNSRLEMESEQEGDPSSQGDS